MSLFASSAVRTTELVASTGAGVQLTSLSVLQALTSAGLPLAFDASAEAAVHDATLRTTLTPLREQPEHLALLALDEPVQSDMDRFLGTESPAPSAPLLTALHAKAPVISGILGGTISTSTRKRQALEFQELSDTAVRQHRAAIHESVDRWLTAINAGSGTSQAGVPKALNLEEVLAHPEQYRDKPLEIVLFDVDGTTHLGETFLEGQYSIEWLVRDILRYGPKATSGLGWWRILKAIPGIINLRLQEKKNGHADRNKFNEVFGPLLKGLDGTLAEESIRRYYRRYGSRGVSNFMKDEFAGHRQAGRLIVGVSASHEFLVRLHAEKDLGIPKDNMLGTTIEIDPETNKATGNFRWLHGEEKVAALEERLFSRLREKGINFRVVAGYSDSPSDKPMLERVLEDGGLIYATNTSKDDFKDWVVENRGFIVEEDEGWRNNGSRKVTIYSSSSTGEVNFTNKTPPQRPEWVSDLGNAVVRTLAEGAGFALAAPVAAATNQAFHNGGHVELSAQLLAHSPTLAAAGMIASAATAYLVPPDGPVSWQRRVVMRGMIPVTAAMVAAGQGGPFGLSVALATALAASAGVELVTGGERMTGLRRWRGGDERKNPFGKAVGFGVLRILQFGGFHALMHGLQRIFG